MQGAALGAHPRVKPSSRGVKSASAEIARAPRRRAARCCHVGLQRAAANVDHAARLQREALIPRRSGCVRGAGLWIPGYDALRLGRGAAGQALKWAAPR